MTAASEFKHLPGQSVPRVVWWLAGQVMMDPYCPVVTHTRLPDNANLVAPKGGAAGSMPINTPQVPLSSLSFLLDDFSFQVRQSWSTVCTVLMTMALAGSCASSIYVREWNGMAMHFTLPVSCGTCLIDSLSDLL